MVGTGTISVPAYNTTNTIVLSYAGMTFTISRTSYYGDRIAIKYGGNTDMTIGTDWTSGQIYVEANSVTLSDGQNSLLGLRLPAITINNMI